MLLELYRKNMMRWRWRYIAIAVLLALACTLFVLYSVFLQVPQSEGVLEKLSLPYDALVVAEPGGRMLSATEVFNELPVAAVWPSLVRYEGMVLSLEEAVSLSVNSSVGPFNVLGISTNLHYRPELLNLEGSYFHEPGEIVLPRALAEREGLRLGDTIELSSQSSVFWVPGLRYHTFTLVGTYDAYDIQPALVHIEDAKLLTHNGAVNAGIFRYNRSAHPSHIQQEPEKLAWFMAWLRGVYPKASILEPLTPVQVSDAMLKRIYQPGQGILALILLFAFVGMLTVAVMTYLERRKELAALKCVGMSNRQLMRLLCMEFGSACLLGLMLGILVIMILSSQISWLSEIGVEVLAWHTLMACCLLAVALVLAILYPLITLQVASVNQLLYGNRIPLRTVYSDHMEHPDLALVYREREENVRILRLFVADEERSEVLVLKSVGDSVKQGETIAISESFFGYVVHEWRAYCDGHIYSLEENGVLSIRPSDPSTGFYAYPAVLLEIEQGRRKRFAKASGEVLGEKSAIENIIAPRDTKITEYAAEAHRQQGARPRASSRTWVQKWKPLWLVLGTSVMYYSLHLGAIELSGRFNYATAVVQRGNLQQILNYSGYLQPALSSEVRTGAAGRVVEILFGEGEAVAQGQELLRLENTSLHLAVAHARETLALAELEYNTLLALDANGNSVLSESHLALLALENEYLALLDEQIALNVYAPASGQISAVHVREGERVGASAPLLEFDYVEGFSEEECAIQLLQMRERAHSVAKQLSGLDVRAETAGVVQHILVQEGQFVEAGTVLATIMQNKDQLDEDTMLKWRAEQLKLEALGAQVEGMHLVAPSQGILGGFDSSVGDRVQATQVIGVLYALAGFDVEIYVPQHEVAAIHVGDVATVYNSYNRQSYQGVVREIASAGNQDTATQRVTFRVIISADSTDAHLFSIGSEVRIAAFAGAELGAYKVVGTQRHSATITASVTGDIAEVYIHNGEHVLPGQAIARLSSSDVDLAYATQKHVLESLLLVDIVAATSGFVERLRVGLGDMVHSDQSVICMRNDVLEAEYLALKQDYLKRAAGLYSTETLSSAANGTVAALLVQAGDTVEAGQLLVQMSNSDLAWRVEQARTSISKLQASLMAEKINPTSGSLALTEVKLMRAQDGLTVAEQALQALSVVAPCDGSIFWQQSVRVGDDLSRGALVATVKADSNLEFSAMVHETDMRYFQQGMPVVMVVPAFDNEYFQGYVIRLDSEATIRQGGEGASIGVCFGLPYDSRFRAGMSVSAYILVKEAPDVLIIPTQSIFYDKSGDEPRPFVNKVEGRKLVPTLVDIGLKAQGYTEVRSGLREGDLVHLSR